MYVKVSLSNVTSCRCGEPLNYILSPTLLVLLLVVFWVSLSSAWRVHSVSYPFQYWFLKSALLVAASLQLFRPYISCFGDCYNAYIIAL